MKTRQHLVRIALLIVVMLVLAGCTSPVLTTPQSQTTATEATWPTELPTGTILPVSQASPTPLPTLPVESQQQLFALLNNNGGCELPCFLGITPGKTSWQDAKAIMEPLSAKRDLVPYSFANAPALNVFFFDIYTNYEVTLDGQTQVGVDINNTVQYVVFTSEILTENYTETRDRHLSWYSISEIFKRHNTPDAIYIYYTNTTLVYSIDIVYETQKFVAHYTGLATLNPDRSYTLCPNMGDGNISYLRLTVGNPNDPNDVKTLTGYPSWQDVPSFEKSTRMTVKEFYHYLIESENPVCFNVVKP